MLSKDQEWGAEYRVNDALCLAEIPSSGSRHSTPQLSGGLASGGCPDQGYVAFVGIAGV